MSITEPPWNPSHPTQLLKVGRDRGETNEKLSVLRSTSHVFSCRLPVVGTGMCTRNLIAYPIRLPTRTVTTREKRAGRTQLRCSCCWLARRGIVQARPANPV